MANHGKTIGTIAIADCSNEWCFESPDRMNQPLFLKRSMQRQSFSLGKRVKKVLMKAWPERIDERISQVK